MIDVERYLQRIGYVWPVQPDLATLGRIAFCHATTVPFENLDVVEGRAVSLDLEAIEAKIVSRRRGGYCFEQNALLSAVLRQIGFCVADLSARVWINNPSNATPPRTHVFPVVTLGGTRWMLDGGLGGPSLTAPIRMDAYDAVQETPHEDRRIQRMKNRLVPTFMHQTRDGDQWIDVVEFTGEAMPKIDQEMGHWWTSSYPESKFKRNLLVALAGAEGTRLSILNELFTRRQNGVVIERRQLQASDELQTMLATHFCLEISTDLATKITDAWS